MNLPVLFCEIKSGAVGKQKHFNEARQQLIHSAPAPVHALGFRSIHIVFVGFTAWINIYNPFCLPLPPQCALAQDNNNTRFANLKEFKLGKYQDVIDFVATVGKIMKPLLSQPFQIIPYKICKSNAITYIYQDINVIKIIPISTKEIAEFRNSSIQTFQAFQATTTKQSSQTPHSLTISALEPVSPNSLILEPVSPSSLNSLIPSVQSPPSSSMHNVFSQKKFGSKMEEKENNASKKKVEQKNDYVVITIFSFISGTDLHSLQKTNHNIELSQVAKLFTYLSSLHKKGLVHNDIRPPNIVYNATGDQFTQLFWPIDLEYVFSFTHLKPSLIPSISLIITKLEAFKEFDTEFGSLPIKIIIENSRVTKGQFFAVLCVYDIYSLYKTMNLSVDTPLVDKFKECLDTIKKSNRNLTLIKINSIIKDLYSPTQPAADDLHTFVFD